MPFINVMLFSGVFYLVSCNVGTLPLPKPQGWDVGSGGNAHGAEFKDIGRSVIRRLKGKGVIQVEEVSVELFEQTLERANIITTEEALSLRGVPVDALNYPAEVRIALSLVHWAADLRFSEKRRLVVHEILGLMRLEASEEYSLTTKVLAALGSSRIYFDRFEVWGDLADKFVEKMPWQSAEIDVQERVTWYRVPAKSKTPEIQCMKVTASSDATDVRCEIWKHAYLDEDGVIHVSLCEEDGNHALWRFFDSIEESRFDYGLIRGNANELLFKLQLFP